MPPHYDVIVIGSGPGGLKAAEHAARAHHRVLLVEQERHLGGSCVQRGTIPSKTLRETAMVLSTFQQKSGGIFDFAVREDMQVTSLMRRLQRVIQAHQEFMHRRTDLHGIEQWHGRARFINPHTIAVEAIDGGVRHAEGQFIVVASGSRPRQPTELTVDHTHILDSDSILSMTYLPKTLTVLGSGVIACEYASIFQSLGVKVTVIDRYPRPLGFLDQELVEKFTESFVTAGGTFLGERSLDSVEWDGVSQVVTKLDDGQEIQTEKVLFALGRVANLESLDIERAGLEVNSRGLLNVDEYCRTSVKHIYAVGDVIGPPSLAAASMEQGRRAMCHAFGIEVGIPTELIPIGIYTIPEMASVGLTEQQANERYGGSLVGRASFGELARGQIAAIPDGMLKLIADPAGRYLLGVQIIGEGASELISLGQLALVNHQEIASFVDTIFNFPTLVEGYRVAALEIVHQQRNQPVTKHFVPA